MRAELERIEIPGAADAEARAAGVVTRAYAERQPVPAAAVRARPLVAVAVVVALLAAVLSPPGRAFVDRVRRAVGIEGAKPALFSLPAPGRLLVHSDAGVWIAQADGSRRLLGAVRRGVVVALRPLRRRDTGERARRRSMPRGTCAGRSRARTSGSLAGAAPPQTRGSRT